MSLDMEALKKIRDDPVLFAERIMHWKPFEYAKPLIRDKSDLIVARMGRQTGKTSNTGVKSIAHAYSWSDQTILIVSPGLRQSMMMFDKVLDFIETNPLLLPSCVRFTRTEVKLTNGSRIIALPFDPHKLRGYTANLIIIDEAAWVPDELITDVLIPMLATTRGQLMLLSTPWGKNNFFYLACQNPDFSRYHVRSIESPMITQAWLDKVKKLPGMTKAKYDREYNALFVEAGNIYLTMDLLQKCVKEHIRKWPNFELIRDIAGILKLERKREYFIGVDLGKLQDHSVIAIIEKAGNILRLMAVISFPIDTKYPKVSNALLKVAEYLQPAGILIDSSGPGESFCDTVEEEGIRRLERTGQWSLGKKAKWLGATKMYMQDLRFLFPFDQTLIDQMNGQEYEYTAGGSLKFTHPGNTWDDELWSVVLACYRGSDKYRGGVVIT